MLTEKKRSKQMNEKNIRVAKRNNEMNKETKKQREKVQV